MKAAAALLAHASAYWFCAAALAPWADVTPIAWALLYAVGAVALLAPTPAWPARRWLLILAYALFFAAFFRGANFGLDALHGAHRRKAEVAAHLGGLELWFVLCPGLAAWAVGGLAHALARAPAHAHKHG